jgi:ribonuclease HI
MFFDGSKMIHGSGAGVILVSPKGDRLSYVLQIHFDSSNNEAQYEALLYGLRMAISLGFCRLMVYGMGRQKSSNDGILQCRVQDGEKV